MVIRSERSSRTNFNSGRETIISHLVRPQNLQGFVPPFVIAMMSENFGESASLTSTSTSSSHSKMQRAGSGWLSQEHSQS